MKRVIANVVFIVVLLFLNGCNNDLPEKQGNLEGLSEDKQKAIEIFLNYRNQLNVSLSRSVSEVDIADVVEMDILFENDNLLSRTNGTERFKLHRVSFCSGEQKGFAIVSTDERVRSNFVYCEKGSIEDTAYIEPVADYIREVIPNLCKNDLENYLKGMALRDTVLSRASQPTIYLDMKTKWSQGAPYNTKLTQINCDGKLVYPYVGCTGIALAQALVYLLPNGYNLYPINEMREVVSCPIYPQGEYNDVIADFIRAVSASYMKYKCDGSGAWLADTRTELRNWGFIEGTGYIYKSSNSLDKGKFYTSLQLNCPTLMSGDNGKGDAHTWILHGQRYNGSTREIYCNYGWGGTCDGWYSDWQRPQYDNGEQPFTGSFYKNNKYMYFLQNRSTYFQ